MNLQSKATKLEGVKVFGEKLLLAKLTTSPIKPRSLSLELHHADSDRPVDLPETYLGKIL